MIVANKKFGKKCALPTIFHPKSNVNSITFSDTSDVRAAFSASSHVDKEGRQGDVGVTICCENCNKCF